MTKSLHGYNKKLNIWFQDGPWEGSKNSSSVKSWWRQGKPKFSSDFQFSFLKAWSAGLIILVSILAWLATGVYHVKLGEQGVVLRFGCIDRVSHEGLRYHWPYPIESVVVQNTAIVNRIDSDGCQLILTGDENIVDVNFTVLWVIKDVKHYLFHAKHPSKTVRSAADSVVREILAQTPMDVALTVGRSTINHKAQALLQNLVDEYGLGIHIQEFQMGRIDPPSSVVDAYRDVQRAKAENQRLCNEAEAYRDSIIPVARGEAKSLIHKAEGVYTTTVRSAEGEAEKLRLLIETYKNNPSMVQHRLYLDTMTRVLQNISSKTIIDTQVGKWIIPHMALPGISAQQLSATEEGVKP